MTFTGFAVRKSVLNSYFNNIVISIILSEIYVPKDREKHFNLQGMFSAKRSKKQEKDYPIFLLTSYVNQKGFKKSEFSDNKNSLVSNGAIENFNIAVAYRNIFELLYPRISLILDNIDILWRKHPMIYTPRRWYINYIISYNGLSNQNLKRLFVGQSRWNFLLRRIIL